MKHTSKNRKLVFVLCTLMPVCLAFCLGTADSSYTYTDPETGIVYYGADEPGGAYSWDLALADYRQTVFEDTWANGSPPPSIPVDMNADGYLDLVFAVGREEFDDRTGDLRRNADLVYGVGDGTGHFPVLTPLVEGIEQYLFAVGDVDKNGRQDVVAILNPNEQHSYQLVLLQQQSDGTFEQSLLMDTPDYAFLEIADVTGDGNLDIVGAGVRLNPTVTEVFVFIGDGDGGFSQPVISAVDAASPFLLSFASPLADYNEDGRLDVCLAALIQEEDPRVKLVIGYSQEDGAISFVVSHALGEYVPRPAIATGDFNGDALPDINILHVVEGDWLLNPEGESATGLSSMYYNNGDGSFAEETLIDLQIPGRKAFSSDLNSDGYDDLVSFDGNGNAGVWLGSATTRQQDVQVYTCLHTPNTRTWSPFMGDFTNDGNVDIGVDLMEPEVGIRFGNGLGGFGTGWFSPPIDSPTTRLQALEDFVADFDGDGHLDLVQLISTDVTVAFGDGTGRFPEIVPILYAREMDEWEIAAGDVNGDGADDLLISSRSNREAGLRLFWGGPDRSFPEGPAAVAGASEHGIEDVSLVDIDEDGHLDLIYAFNGVLHVTHGDGAGSFEVYTSIGEPPTLNGPDPAIYDYWLEDVNKDSYVDIITNAFPSLYRLWLNDGNNRWIFTEEHEKVYYQSNREAWDAAPEWVRIPQIEISYHRADLDNDGIADFVTANDSLLQIALTGSEAALLNFCAQGHGQLVRVRNPIAADINGDGWLDLITASANYITVVLNRLGEASL